MTKLLYLEQFTQLEMDAVVVDVLPHEDGRTILILDQTVFYPQGGGQPYDKGRILSPNGEFLVDEVRFVDGDARHIGTFSSGMFQKGESVHGVVDQARRQLHARIHSAGHIIDKAIGELGLGWKPGKGYHFPDGPYDEYEGSLEGLDKDKVKADIERVCNECIERGGPTGLVFMSREEMEKTCHYVPDFPLEKGERARVVVHSGYSMPCGGTPVADLSQIGHITIRKLKQKGDRVQVGYDVER